MKINSTNINIRWGRHLNELIKDTHPNKHLQRSKERCGEGNPFYGKKHSKEAKKKISESIIGELNPFYGKTHSKKFRDISSKIHKGKVMLEESKIKISQSLSGRKKSKEHIEKIAKFKRKKVIQIDINSDRVLKIWESATEASKYLNINKKNIGACCRGVQKISGGFKWQYYV